ncbi:MAG: pYEATS domain-containing protein, partial [Bacteroidota bacterium]
MSKCKLVKYLLLIAMMECWSVGVMERSCAQPKELSFNNTAKYVGNGRYDWTVFVDADSATLAPIKSVEYTLDPTFPNPVRTVTKRENRFALSSNGWGVFTIYIKVFFTNGKVGNYKYPLSFSKPAYGQTTPLAQKKQPAAQVAPPPSSEEKINLDAESIT